MLLVDTQEKCVIQDVELKRNIAQSRPHTKWLEEMVNVAFVFILFSVSYNISMITY